MNASMGKTHVEPGPRTGYIMAGTLPVWGWGCNGEQKATTCGTSPQSGRPSPTRFKPDELRNPCRPANRWSWLLAHLGLGIPPVPPGASTPVIIKRVGHFEGGIGVAPHQTGDSSTIGEVIQKECEKESKEDEEEEEEEGKAVEEVNGKGEKSKSFSSLHSPRETQTLCEAI